jgi:hypothetical protein
MGAALRAFARPTLAASLLSLRILRVPFFMIEDCESKTHILLAIA